MADACIKLYGNTPEDWRVRPSGSENLMLHWAFRLVDALGTYDPVWGRPIPPVGVWVRYDTHGYGVGIAPSAWKDNDAVFRKVLEFARDNRLTYEFPDGMCACDRCPGHEACLVNEHKVDFDLTSG